MRRTRGRLLCSSCYHVSGFAWGVFGKWTVPEFRWTLLECLAVQMNPLNA